MFKFENHQSYFPELLQQHGRWQRRRQALVFEDQVLLWPEFSDQIRRCASALTRHGVGKGDRVAVVMDNSIEMAVSLFGIMSAGAVSVPINLSVTTEAIAAMISDAQAVSLFVSDGQQPRMAETLERLEVQPQLLVTTAPAVSNWLHWDAFLADGNCEDPLPELVGGDVLNIIYSSGTTGTPKGIVHTHQGRLDWATDLAIALRYPVGARTLLTIGLYSNISWVGMLSTLLSGGTLVIKQRFDATDVASTIAAEGITNMAMVPLQYQRLVEACSAQQFDMSSLYSVMSCGSPLPPLLKQQLFELLPCGVIELYGLTEGVITTLQPEDAEGRWSSVGKPLAGTDIRIIDEQGSEVAAGATGEIVSRGRITMPGYLNRPDASQAASWVDDHGITWLRTGDIGKLDEEGFLYIVDRKKDLILSGGQNIYPQDIEAVVIAHEQVDDVAVIPAKSNRWGETPVALVKARPDIDADALMSWCNERLGRQQRLADVIFVEALPRNPNGKLLKRELRETYRELRYH